MPARPHYLLFLGQREFAWRHVLGNGRAGTYGCARMDGDRRNQLDIGTDQYVVLDHGAVLVHAVVVARDGAGADIHVASYAGVAHVGEMVGLRAHADVGRFDFDEIADVHLRRELGAGPDARVRPDPAVIPDRGFVDQRKRLDARRAKAACLVRRGDFSLTMSIRGQYYEYAVQKALNLVNELFLLLHETYPDYMIEHFGLSAE